MKNEERQKASDEIREGKGKGGEVSGRVSQCRIGLPELVYRIQFPGVLMKIHANPWPNCVPCVRASVHRPWFAARFNLQTACVSRLSDGCAGPLARQCQYPRRPNVPASSCIPSRGSFTVWFPPSTTRPFVSHIFIPPISLPSLSPPLRLYPCRVDER